MIILHLVDCLEARCTLAIGDQFTLSIYNFCYFSNWIVRCYYTPAKSVLTGGEDLMNLETDNLAVVYPNPDLPQNLEQHERVETVECDPIFGSLGFGHVGVGSLNASVRSP